jgi:hypothetical protein
MIKLIFDTICIDNENQPRKCFDPVAFAKVPLSERIKCILEKRVFFYNQGELLDSRAALKNYREWAASA